MKLYAITVTTLIAAFLLAHSLGLVHVAFGRFGSCRVETRVEYRLPPAEVRNAESFIAGCMENRRDAYAHDGCLKLARALYPYLDR